MFTDAGNTEGLATIREHLRLINTVHPSIYGPLLPDLAKQVKCIRSIPLKVTLFDKDILLSILRELSQVEWHPLDNYLLELKDKIQEHFKEIATDHWKECKPFCKTHLLEPNNFVLDMTAAIPKEGISFMHTILSDMRGELLNCLNEIGNLTLIQALTINAFPWTDLLPNNLIDTTRGKLVLWITFKEDNSDTITIFALLFNVYGKQKSFETIQKS